MKFSSSLLLSALSVIPMQAQEVYLQEKFENGIPATFTTFDEDELPVKSGFRIPVDGNWFTNSVYGSNGKSALSAAANDFNLPVSNWLITPAIEITSPNAVLTWDAKSVHYDLREDYKVLVSTTGNQLDNFKEIAQITEEGYTWQHHAIPLTKYAGSKIYVAFVHNSENRFLLAIDNLFAGVPNQPAFDAENKTPHFCGINNATVQVKGKIRNIGSEVEVKEIICTSGLHVLTQSSNQTLPTGASTDFTFELPTALDTNIPYRIDVKNTDGTTINVLEDQIVCSYFPRTLLVEKGTGVWCTSCPAVMGYLNELKEEYGNEVVMVESHTAFNDHAKLSYAPYDEGMASSNYPVIYFNRNQKYKSYNKQDAQATLKEVIKESTPAWIKASAILKEGKIAVTTHIEFGKELDNAKDKYRVGFALLQKHLQLPFAIQKNVASGPEYEEYGLLTSPFNKDFMFFHNVVKGTPSAFKGVAGSLPSLIEAGSSFTQEHILDIPDGYSSTEDLTVVAFVLDYFNNRVLNTAECNIDTENTGIVSNETHNLEAEVQIKDEICTLRLPYPENYVLEIYNEKGQLLLHKKYNASHIKFSMKTWEKGCYLLRISQKGKQTIQKIYKK